MPASAGTIVWAVHTDSDWTADDFARHLLQRPGADCGFPGADAGIPEHPAARFPQHRHRHSRRPADQPRAPLCAKAVPLARHRLYRHFSRHARAGRAHPDLLRAAFHRHPPVVLGFGNHGVRLHHVGLFGGSLPFRHREHSPGPVRGGERAWPAVSADAAQGHPSPGDTPRHSADYQQLRVDVQGHIAGVGGSPCRSFSRRPTTRRRCTPTPRR